MPTIADNAVCLRRWDFSETSQTVSLFTREHGVIRGLAKGAKRERGTFSGGLDPLTRGQIVAIVKPGKELATLTHWTLDQVYWALRRDLAANRAGLYMADLVHHMLTPGQEDPHPGLYDALTQALSVLEVDATHVTVGTVLLRFQWLLLCETGYEPRLTLPGQKGTPVYRFHAAAGGLIADDGEERASSATWRVRAETVELLRNLASKTAGIAAPHVAANDAETFDRGNRLLAAYIREILGHEVPTMEWAFPAPNQ